MTDLTPEALEARQTLSDAIGNGESDAVIVSSDPDGPSLWSQGLKMAVFGLTTAAVLGAASTGAKFAAQEITDATFGPREEISFQLDEPTIQAFAEQVGPKIYGMRFFSDPSMVVEIGETSTEDSSRFFTLKDPSDKFQASTECYAIYQPAMWDLLGSGVRLENTMESFALAHCMMAGEGMSIAPNISGEAELGQMMTNLAAARLIEGNVLGEDGRELSDSSSVRDAWFGSQFSQRPVAGLGDDFEGVAAYLVLKRADETLLAHGAPGTISEFRDQALSIVENGLEDVTPLVRQLDRDAPSAHLTRINVALRDVYNGSSAETRLDRMDDFMRNPIAATSIIEADGLDAYLEGMSSRASLEGVQITDPFSAPVLTASMDNFQVQNPFEIRPEADVSFDDGPGY